MFKTGDKVASNPWQAELDAGKHWRAKLGFILMSTDLAAESDIFAMAPEGVAVHFTRLKTDDYTTNETLARHIEAMADAAARLQPDTQPDVISYSCTSGSIVIGERRIMDEINRGAPYARPMTLVTGVVDALSELGARRLVVGTPYLDEINTAEAEFLVAKGFEGRGELQKGDGRRKCGDARCSAKGFTGNEWLQERGWRTRLGSRMLDGRR